MVKMVATIHVEIRTKIQIPNSNPNFPYSEEYKNFLVNYNRYSQKAVKTYFLGENDSTDLVLDSLSWDIKMDVFNDDFALLTVKTVNRFMVPHFSTNEELRSWLLTLIEDKKIQVHLIGCDHNDRILNVVEDETVGPFAEFKNVNIKLETLSGTPITLG